MIVKKYNKLYIMNNLTFLNTINNKIIRKKSNNLYYISFNLPENYRYSIYILINDKLINNYEPIYGFVKKCILENNINDEYYILGEDFFISESYNTDKNINTEFYYTDLYFDNLLFNENDYEIVDLIDFNYLNKLNINETSEFSEQEIKYFYRTFSLIILDNIYKDNIDFSNTKNNIYNNCLEFLKNYKSDTTLINLQLILSNSITISNNNNQTINSCNCNCSSVSNMEENLTCAEIYIKSIYTYIENMLGDYEFYENWFLVNDYPNLSIINKLEKLINQVLLTKESELNNINNLNNNSLCGCSSLEYSSCKNSKILENYKQILEYVKDNKIQENKNKIKIFGSEFGKLLPYIEF